MPRSLLLVLCLGSATATFHSMVELVNSRNLSWTATLPTRFGAIEEVRKLCGAWTRGHPLYTEQNLPEYIENPFIESTMADTLDWREAAPNCTVISRVRDQSSCGSCWAFGSTDTFSDRRCVATGEDLEFSAMDTAGCCSGLSCGFSRGCDGGQPTAALKWMSRTGVVTGKDYAEMGDGTSCKPYTFEPCAHHVAPTPDYPVCPEKEFKATCKKTCSDEAYETKYALDKRAEGEAKTVSTVKAMLTALQKGPLSVAFTVHEDFPTYKSGVYHHAEGKSIGGHAVEIIGYGTEGKEDYWLVKNSWNAKWGDGGTFKIRRGVNECGIEDTVAAIDF